MFGSGDGIGLLKRFHGGLEIFKTDSHWKWPLNEAFGSKRLSADPVSLRAWCFVGSSNVLRLEPHFGLDFHPHHFIRPTLCKLAYGVEFTCLNRPKLAPSGAVRTFFEHPSSRFYRRF